VRITLGTDGNRPWGPHEEMLDMVLAGMTPMQVIVAATRNSAEFLRIADAGTLEAGKRQLHRARRKPAGRHHQHATHSGGRPARRGPGPRTAGPLR
jgi:Amidohydrolase family